MFSCVGNLSVVQTQAGLCAWCVVVLCRAGTEALEAPYPWWCCVVVLGVHLPHLVLVCAFFKVTSFLLVQRTLYLIFITCPPHYVSLKVNILALSLLFCYVISFRPNFWGLFFFSELWAPESESYLFEVLWISKCGIKVTMKCNETHGWLIRVRRAGDVSYS